LEESGGTPETETHRKNSNIIYTHAKCKYRNSQKKLSFNVDLTNCYNASLPWKKWMML